tara:strand:+ start:693 stop:842 length:150 start_codon:yes stop_codon:yes gene_type:complete
MDENTKVKVFVVAVIGFIALSIIPAFIPLKVTNVECTEDTKYCLNGIRE